MFTLKAGLLKSPFQVSLLACKHGRLRRPRRFFAVSAPFAFPKGRQKAQKLQKRIVQRQSLCTNATFEKPWAAGTVICQRIAALFRRALPGQGWSPTHPACGNREEYEAFAGGCGASDGAVAQVDMRSNFSGSHLKRISTDLRNT